MKQFYLKILVFGAILSLACTTKVSEWVLLNSVPDKYLLVYFHKNEISETTKKQNSEIEIQLKSANVSLKTVQRPSIEKPFYALYYNNRLIAEYASKKELTGIASSPLREVIAKELMAGKLCVLLYLKCGEIEKDEMGLEVVNISVEESPYGSVTRIVELDRDNADESELVSMLLNVESDLKQINEPMLFGVFGKFRALEPLLAKGISQDNINLMLNFLTADCSCLIKDDLPGMNILFNASWEKPQTALVNKIIDENPHLEHQ